MARLRFDQINIVVPDVVGVSRFLLDLGVDVPEIDGAWADWAPHHGAVPVVDDGFGADLDSPAFARHWGGLPPGFAGVVVNLRTEDRSSVDATFDRALELGAEARKAPYNAFWGARYAVVMAPGPLALGIMSPVDPEQRSAPPSLGDFT